MGLKLEFARTSILLIASVVACAPAAAAELYKWVDQRGVTNYSNMPPARTADRKSVTIVENRLSVYTPDERLTEALERARARQSQRTERALPAGEPGPRVAVLAPPAPIPADPCLDSRDPNCDTFLYESFPVFYGVGHSGRLAQPKLPVGTTAGNVTRLTGYIPGQSAQAAPQAPFARTASKRLHAKEPRTAAVTPPDGVRPDRTRARPPRQGHAPSRR